MPIRDRLTAVGLVVAAVLAAPSPLSGQQRDVRDLSGFHSVSVGGGLDLYLKRGDTFVVEVDGDDDPSKIITEVRDGTLEVRRDGKWTDFFGAGDEGEVYVTMPTLEALSASGGSDVSVEGTFSGDALRVAASGGSDVELDATMNSVDVQASGGSDVELTGSARSARLQSSGGADIDAARFVVDEANVESSGGSDLSIGVRNSITGHASGGSDVTYTGNPATVNVESSGGGDVTRR
jgi:hypothetical protein